MFLSRAAVGADLGAEELLQLAGLLNAASAIKRQVTACAAQLRDSVLGSGSDIQALENADGVTDDNAQPASLQPLEVIVSGIDASLATNIASEVTEK